MRDNSRTVRGILPVILFVLDLRAPLPKIMRIAHTTKLRSLRRHGYVRQTLVGPESLIMKSAEFKTIRFRIESNQIESSIRFGPTVRSTHFGAGVVSIILRRKSKREPGSLFHRERMVRANPVRLHVVRCALWLCGAEIGGA